MCRIVLVAAFVLCILAMSRQSVINREGTQQVAEENIIVIKTAFEDDSPRYYSEECSAGLLRDQMGICREVWFEEYEDKR